MSDRKKIRAYFSCKARGYLEVKYILDDDVVDDGEDYNAYTITY